MPYMVQYTYSKGEQRNKNMQKIAEQHEDLGQNPAKNSGMYYDWFVATTEDKIHEEYLKNYQPILEEFISHMPKRGHVIDLGCGLGLVVHKLFTRGFLVHGIESSPLTISKANAYFPYLDIRLGDVRKFKKQAPLHGIYERLALMYLPKPELRAIFKKIFTELEPGGVFQATFEEADIQENGWYPYETEKVIKLSNGLHRQATVPVCVTYYTKEQLVEELTDVGFTVVKIWHYREPQTTHRNLLTVLCQKDYET